MYQWIFTILGMCMDLVEMWFGIEIWFGIANGYTSSSFDSLICLPHVCIFVFV